MSFILYTRRNHKRCSSRFDILDSSAIGWPRTPEQECLPNSQRPSHFQHWYHNRNCNQDEGFKKKKSREKWVEEWDEIILDPLDLNWLWPKQTKIWVWSLGERSLCVQGITDYRWRLKSSMWPGSTMKTWSVKERGLRVEWWGSQCKHRVGKKKKDWY